VQAALAGHGARAEADLRNEKLGYRIREAQLQKIPYMLVVGAREEEEGTVSVRRRAGDDLGAMSLDHFLARFNRLVAARSLEI
jgi:threonyl-tRNA synthetase